MTHLDLPFWSLQRVQNNVTFPDFSSMALVEKKFVQAPLLTALTSGKHMSHLCALNCHPVLTTFAPEGFQVSLAPSPLFLDKNVTEHHCLNVLCLPSPWSERGQPHLLLSGLSVMSLDATEQAPLDRLIVWPT